MTELPFKVVGINHIGIVPKDFDKCQKFFASFLGFVSDETVAAQKTRTVSYRSGSDSSVELLDATESTSPIAKFQQKRGSGIHHIAIEVRPLELAVDFFKKAGHAFTTESWQLGANNMKTIFFHPNSTGGILVELVEHS